MFNSIIFVFLEAAHPSKSGGCFKGTSEVMTSTGERKAMSDLKIGEEVLSMTSEGHFTFSPVLLFLDRDPNERRHFYTLTTQRGKSITLTPTHLIYVLNEDSDAFDPVYASEIRPGDRVLILSDGAPVSDVVVSVDASVMETGVFAPLTKEGNLVVDGVLASCYAVVDSQSLAHNVFAPIRWAYSWFGNAETTPQNGVHWYAEWLFNVAENVIPDRIRR